MSILDAFVDRRSLLHGRWRRVVGETETRRPPPGAEAILVFDEGRCWARGGIDPGCDYCFDRCPLKGEAVTYRPGFGPVFIAAECTGCGICGYYCPASPRPLSFRPL